LGVLAPSALSLFSFNSFGYSLVVAALQEFIHRLSSFPVLWSL